VTDSTPPKGQVVRNEKGQFVKGVSGNANGRPKGTKNHLVALKQDLEIAVRENLQPGDIQDIVNSMVHMAKGGDVSAAKLILDKVISPAKVEQETEERDETLVVRIENVSFKMPSAEEKDLPPIEGEFTQESTE